MANCGICNAKAGIAPPRIEIGNESISVCSSCYMEYMNMESGKIQLQNKAIQYFKERLEPGTLLNYINSLEESLRKSIEEDNANQAEREYIKEHRLEIFKDLMLTNGFNFEGYRIEKYLGVVSGDVVIGTGFLSEFSAGISDMFGGKSSAFSEKMQEVKAAAIERMKNSAVDKGANAIIGISFEFITFSSNMIGVSVNGTAVKTAPLYA